MQLRSRSFAPDQAIPAEFAFGQPGTDGPLAFAPNRNPHLAWDGVPPGTRSFVLTCIDTDVPSRGDDVNQPGRTVPADLPRVAFVHWLLIDIPADQREIAAGSASDGITARGKRNPPGPAGSRQGLNDYTGWFAHDPAMSGDYYGYDGPCPPWNDTLLHHYHFRLIALDTPRLGLSGRFTWAEVEPALRGHVLAEAVLTGTYSMNPALRA